MTDVTPNLKAKVDCGCGTCGRYGTPNKWGCVRGCPCRRCLGKRNRRKGLEKQNTARKALGVPSGKFGASNEENWADEFFATEVKAGNQCGPIANAYLKAETQIRSNETEFGGWHKFPRVVSMPTGWSGGLVTVRTEVWAEFIRPALEAFWGVTNEQPE